VRAQAKRSSAANRDGSTTCGFVIGRLDDALTARSPGVEGTSVRSRRGAPPCRARRTYFALSTLVAIAAVLAIPPLSAAKVVVNGFGTVYPGESFFGETRSFLGGEFVSTGFESSPRGVAVNSSGNGAPAGTSYVVDGRGNRIQRFGPNGNFQRLWGKDVIAPSADEQQRVEVDAAAGAYTLAFQGDITDPIPHDADSNVVGDALQALPSIGGANVIVDDYENQGVLNHLIIFRGGLAAANQPQIAAGSSELIGTVEISTLLDGTSATTTDTGTGLEICTVATECKAAAASSMLENGGQLDDPQGVAVNQSNGHVYVTEAGNRRVSEFDPDGNFVRAWGHDVISAGQPNDTGTGFEVCEVVAECKQGASGANGGQFGESVGYPVTDAADNVWVADPANRRIQKFDPVGNFIAAYGYDVDALGGGGALETCTSTAAGACKAATAGSGPGQFSTDDPRQIALDAAGNVYAVEGFPDFRVHKFDPAFATGSNFATATFAAYTTRSAESITSAEAGTRLDFYVQNNVTGGGELQILELDPSDGSASDAGLVGAGLTQVFSNGYPFISGLAANNAAGTVYATTYAKASPRAILVLGDTLPPDPVAALKPILVKTDTTAVFEATVDPKDGLVSCRFQYSADGTNWTDVPERGCESLAAGGGIQAVSQGVTGLTPNTEYFIRLQVSRPLAPSSVTSFTKSFSTDSVAPIVSNVGALQIDDTSARLAGTIDPRNSATGYVFEYGTTPALGSSTEPFDIGGGASPITVSQVVDGLTTDTTYHFRLVATNAFGATPSDQRTFRTRAIPLPPPSPANCGNHQARQEQNSSHLPDCRAYEMVSPTDKNQGQVEPQGTGFSRDGTGAAFCTSAIFGDPPGQMSFFCAPYLSKRGASGWTTMAAGPRYCPMNPGAGPNETIGSTLNTFPSPESFDRVVVSVPELAGCPFPPLDPAAQVPAINLYRQDFTTNPFRYDLLAPDPNPISGVQAVNFGGGSADFSHIVYGSIANQTPDSPGLGNLKKLYDWEEQGHGSCTSPGGCLSLVSVDPSGNPFETWSKLPGGRGAFEDETSTDAVSADGERIYFQNEVTGLQERVAGHCETAACDLYLRESGTTPTTFHVSASECTVDCGVDSSPDDFVWANPMGDKAIFRSCAKLTDQSADPETCVDLADQSTGKLYRWDRDGAPGHRLVDITIDQEPADGVQPRAYDVIDASDDGDVAFFLAQGQLVPTKPINDGLKLYRWLWNEGAPTVEYLAPYLSLLPAALPATTILTGHDPNINRLHVRVTPDGKYLLVQTKFAYDPVSDRDSDVDLYRWDETQAWVCVSCQLPGVPSAGHVNTFEPELKLVSGQVGNIPAAVSTVVPESTISDDGQRIFFTTPDALVPEDLNGETGCPVAQEFGTGQMYLYSCQDIYEWHDGTLSLISSGTDTSEPVGLLGATHDGSDVFFTTTERLVGWDADTSTDIYTAHAGGGFPEPPPAPPGCEGEACRGPRSTAPSSTGAGSAAFQGPGNPKGQPNQRKCPKGKRRVLRRGKVRCIAPKRRTNRNRRAAR
jgi:NHL repeat-containing protein